MKLFAVFLACIVATQAIPQCPGYSYWCSHNFWVFPYPSSYCYRIPFDRSWCTARYYSNCLVEFPKSIPVNTCEAEQSDIVGQVQKIRVKLEKERALIKSKMMAGRKDFEDLIDRLHLGYLGQFKAYLSRSVCVSTLDYHTRLIAYMAELARIKKRYLDQFDADVIKKDEQIKAFHERLLSQFQSCLTSRKSRVDQYELSLLSKAKEIQRVYAECLTQHVTKRVTWVVSVFKKIYDNNVKSQDFKVAMTNYEKHLNKEKSDLILAFAKKVSTAVAQMIDCYRCNYKCYFSTGCYGFSRRSFRKSSCSLPRAPRYCYKLVGLCAFNPEWKAPPCPVPTTPKKTPAVKETFDEKPYLLEIDNTAAKQGNELKLQVAKWKMQVLAWKIKSIATLFAKVETMYPKQTYCGQVWTTDEIDAFRKGLKAQVTSWITQQCTKLFAQITRINAMWTGRIESWRVQATAFIMRIKSRFTCCMANKTSKVTQYGIQMDQRIAAMRARLTQRLESAARHHKCLFDRFYECSFGKAPISTDPKITQLKKDYHDCIDTKVSRVIQLFNQFWIFNKPKFISIYECGFKCTPKVTVPTFRACYQWRFCAPSLSCFRFYCY